MPGLGRSGLVAAALSCILLSQPAEGAIIGTPTEIGIFGSFSGAFGGSLTTGNDIALLYTFSVAEGSTAEFTATLSEGGFLGVLTLFRAPASLGPFDAGFQYPTPTPEDPLDQSPLYQYEQQEQYPSGFLAYSLSPGSYLLTLSQSPNLFEPFVTGFSAANDPAFLDEAFPDCLGFVTESSTCGTGDFSGTFSAQATVPEPATLSLVTLGASALWIRRRRRRRSGIRQIRPS